MRTTHIPKKRSLRPAPAVPAELLRSLSSKRPVKPGDRYSNCPRCREFSPFRHFSKTELGKYTSGWFCLRCFRPKALD